MINMLHNSKSENPKNIRLGAIALSLMAATFLPACTSSEVATTDDTTENITAEEVADETSNYAGQTVTIRGDVNEVVGEASFLMDDEQLLGGEEILVVNASGEGITLPEGTENQVQITGEVRNFVIADLETEYGLDFDPNLYAEYEQKPAVIAQSIALSPDPGDITANPENYYYQRIAVQGEVEEIRSTGVFTVDEEQLFGGEDLLVITANPDPRVNEDESVTIVGTLRPFVEAEFERDYDLTWDLDFKQEIEAEYENKPVFVADEIYPSAL
ncbi:hypothetical protein [Lyngbya sp. PCC 8106]|uniref:hypothetical protein n=1 Tax=Lyngbya sp. (strain PCC 8106) TaxID=313612 RepID=UPI0000EA9DE5|nr:hypothetical protein [Lyngbya sp. PCC 8106]EAW38927.1 hypothetical protein L8106_01392 [Lyngbya sp. PCC 8106]